MQRIRKLTRPTDKWLPSIEKYPEEDTKKSENGDLGEAEKEKDFATNNGVENNAYVIDEKPKQMESNPTQNGNMDFTQL